jgi:peptide/nickel transport system permease protein
VQQYILQRLLLMIPVLFLVVSMVFVATRVVSPGYVEDKVALNCSIGTQKECKKHIQESIGTDKPLWQQYLYYLGDTVRFDFGNSLLPPENSVMYELKGRLGPSIELGILEIIIAVAIALPVGIISAVRQDTWLDYLVRFIAVLGLAIPSFFLGTLMLIVAFQWFSWAPPLTTEAYRGFFEDPQTNMSMMLMPALAGGIGTAAIIMRLLRSQLLEVLRQDYVRTAWAKGLRERSIIIRHALKNALIPVFTIIGLLVATLFGANVVLETLFNIPGAGLFIVNSMINDDFPVVQALILLVAIALVFTNLVVDISYAWLDPRIRYG